MVKEKQPELEMGAIWQALSQSPGIGVSIIDSVGRLLYENDTSCALFFDRPDADYQGKTLADFHPKEFVVERLHMIRLVLEKRKPLRLSHVYHGRRIVSTIWPVLDKKPPYDRVIVISNRGEFDVKVPSSSDIETFATEYIELGDLDVLTHRELEVLVLLGHGQNVPETAAMLYRSPKTVQRHKAAISSKLQLHGQADLVRLVSRLGLELPDCNLQRMKFRKPKSRE
jgi:DNA-binding CsgD family transcriptional regulator